MASRKCKITNLDKEINKILTEYGADVDRGVKKAISTVAKIAQQEVKQRSPVLTGDYKKDWKKRENASSLFVGEAIVYNRSNYQLTHLLEKGHAKRKGGRMVAKPIVHIETAQRHAVENLTKAVESIAGK